MKGDAVFKRGLRTARRDHGVVDLASLIVGSVVTGIVLTGIIGASIGIISFIQDDSARAGLSAIVDAESGARVGNGDFAPLAKLEEAGLFTSGKTTPVNVAVGKLGACYVAVAASDSGRSYFVSSRDTEPQLWRGAADTSWCANISAP